MNQEQEIFNIWESCIASLKKAAFVSGDSYFEQQAEAATYAYFLLKRQQLFLDYPMESETVH